MLFSIFADTKNFGLLGFDRDESFRIFGEDIENQFDVNWRVKSFASIWHPMTVDFTDDNGSQSKPVPDISEHHGRLFLTQEAREIIGPLLEGDGEFLPVNFRGGSGYLFNPLKLAESVGGLNRGLSLKDEFDDVTNIAFHEEKVSDLKVFKSSFNYFSDLFCQDSVRKRVEKSGLKGVWFTPDLGNRYQVYSGVS